MREHKYRCWDGEEMYYLEDGYYLIFWDHPQKVNYALYSVENDCLISKEDRGLKLMEFTGLYDKNNKPIYEGDIVKFKNQVRERWGEIIFERGTFMLNEPHLKEWNKSLFCCRMDMNQWEILGNQFENPELGE